MAEELPTEPAPTEYISRLDAMTMEETESTGSSLGSRIVQSWRDMRTHTRGLIEEHLSEHRLLFYVMLSDLIFFVSFSIRTLVSPAEITKSAIGLETAKWLVAALLIRTAIMYLLSFLIYTASKMSGGTGSWYDTRVGTFWGALVSAPFDIMLALIGGAISYHQGNYPVLSNSVIALIVLWGGFLPFFWYISQGIAEAQGFKRNLIAFGALLVLGSLTLYAAVFFGATGLH